MLKNQPKFKSAWLNLTEKCNLNCSYCFVKKFEDKESPRKDMTEGVAMAAMDYFYRYGQEGMTITFFGGEPLLRWDVIRKIMEKYNVMHYAISTNATLLTEEIINFFEKRKDFVHIILSIDGTATSQMASRGKMFDEDNIRMLCKKCTDVKARMTVLDPETCLEDIKYFYNLGLRNIKVNIPYCVPLKEDYYVRMREVKDKVLADKNLKDIVSLKDEPLGIPDEGFTHCHPGEDYATVTVDGDFYPCDLFALKKEYKLGNIYDGIDEDVRNDFLKDMAEAKKEMYSLCIAEQIYDRDIAIRNWKLREK